MSDTGINIKITTSAQLEALKQTEKQLIQQTTAARAAGTSLKDLGEQTRQLADIKITKSAQLEALKQTEKQLIQQITSARAASTSLKDLGEQTRQLAAVQGQMKGMGFFGRLGAEAMGAAQSIPILGRVMTAANGGAGILSAGLAGLTSVAAGARAALSSFSTVEDLQTSFVTLLGSVGAAQARMAELAKFAAETPFELPEVAKASKILQNMTGGALSVGAGLRMVGDVAASANVPFQEVALSMGRLYAGMRDGTPYGEAALRMTEITGINFTQVKSWDAVTAALSKYNGEMERRSATVSGKESNLSDSFNMLLASLGKPIAPAYKDFLTGTTEALEGAAAKVSSLVALFEKNGGAIKTFTGTVLVLAETFATKFVLDKIIEAAGAFTSRTVASTAAVTAETLAIEANTAAKAGNAVAGVASAAGSAGGLGAAMGMQRAAQPFTTEAQFAAMNLSQTRSTLAGNAKLAELEAAAVKSSGLMSALGGVLRTLTGPLGMLLAAVVYTYNKVTSAQKKDLGQQLQDTNSRLKTSSGFNKRANDVDTQEKRDALVKEIEDYLSSPEGEKQTPEGTRGLYETISRLRARNLPSQGDYVAEWQRAEDDKKRREISKDLSFGLTDTENKKTFDALDDKGKLQVVNANLSAAQATVGAGGSVSVEDQEQAAKRILEYTQQRNDLVAKIAETELGARREFTQDLIKKAHTKAKETADNAAKREALDLELAIAEAVASGDKAAQAKLKWQQDYNRLLKEGLDAKDPDAWNKAIRGANAQAGETKSLDKSVSSAMHAVGGARGEVYVAQNATLAEAKKTNDLLQKIYVKPPVVVDTTAKFQ